MLKQSQESPGVLSSMLFTISRALRVCKNLPDSDYLLMKLSDGMRAMVDHLNAYEDFTGLALVGSELDLVDVEEWVNGPRTNETIELTMLDLSHRLRLANPASGFTAEEVPDNRIAAPPNLAELLMEHQRWLVAQQQDGGGTAVAAVGGGVGRYTPTSPVYVPTHQAAAGGGGMPVQVPIPIPVPVPVLGAPVVGAPVVSAPIVTTVTTHGPTPPSSPRIRRAGAPSPASPRYVPVATAPMHRMESVEHLFIPDEQVV
jgi:hypothetical protein